MTTYICDDGTAEIEIKAEDAEAAAQEYVDGGDWGDGSETHYIRVYVWPAVTVTADDLELSRATDGSGGWSLHLAQPDEGVTLQLLDGPAEWDRDTGWDRPSSEDYAEAIEVLQNRARRDREQYTITVEASEPAALG